MKIGVVGCGKVGFNTLKAFHVKGLNVLGYDTDTNVIEKIKKEIGNDAGTSSFQQLAYCDAIFECVPTEPKNELGECDLSILEDVINKIVELEKLPDYKCKVFIQRSTCPPGTAKEFSRFFKKTLYAVNPSFLRKKTQWEDSIRPERIAIAGNEEAVLFLKEIYKPFNCSNFYSSSSLEAVELLKYIENLTDAVLISLWNEFLLLSDSVSIPRNEFVSMINSFTERAKFATALRIPGQAFGLWCLPKDIAAINYIAKKKGINLRVIEASILTNDDVKKVKGVNSLSSTELYEIIDCKMKLSKKGISFLDDKT